MNSKSITIRQAVSEDIDALLDLDRLFCEERQTMLDSVYRNMEAPLPKESLMDRVCGPDFKAFVAEHGNIIVGYLIARIKEHNLPGRGVEKEGHVCDLFVIKEFRNQGIASILYNQAGQWFDEAGCAFEGLTVYSSNPALNLYTKWGFNSFSINMRKVRKKTWLPEDV